MIIHLIVVESALSLSTNIALTRSAQIVYGNIMKVGQKRISSKWNVYTVIKDITTDFTIANQISLQFLAKAMFQ